MFRALTAIASIVMGTAAYLSADGVTPTSTLSDVRSDMMCGPNCLWQVAYLYGKRQTLGAATVLAETDPAKGTSVQGMLNGARAMGLHAQAVRTTYSDLLAMSCTAILLLDPILEQGPAGHFVVLASAGPDSVRLIDGERAFSVDRERFLAAWGGNAILVSDKPIRCGGANEAMWSRVAWLTGTLALVAVAAIAVHWKNKLRGVQQPDAAPA